MARASYVKEMIRRVEEAGGEIQRSRRGHYKVYLEGRLIGSLPATPSDRRTELNDIAMLRRNGLPIAKRRERK
jgi:hypothetical protein